MIETKTIKIAITRAELSTILYNLEDRLKFQLKVYLETGAVNHFNDLGATLNRYHDLLEIRGNFNE